MVTLILLISLISAFSILFLKKIGAVEYGQVHGTKLIAKMLHCDFCLSFWVNVVFTIICIIFVGLNREIILLPIFATPITRILT